MRRVLFGAVVALAFPVGFARAVQVSVVPAFPNLPPFSSPINIEDPGDGTDRLFVVERAGRIQVFQNDPSVSQRSLFLDISGSVTTFAECGLLGLAFHPDYQMNRYFYVLYVDPSPFQTVIARFTTSAGDPNVADPASELPLITLLQETGYHKGGCIAFGPDGYLYIALGEDGTPLNSQDRSNLKGKLLRIDVDNPEGGMNYGIPPDNPYRGNPSGYREEIYAFGFRNPWRFGFDFATERIWLGDVGQDTYEEVDDVRKGRNYGWPLMEGIECFSPPECDTIGLDLAAPVFVYPHNGSGASITGGRVYRGPSSPSLFGQYVYADFVTGRISALDVSAVPPVSTEIDDTMLSIAAFGEDADGELYFSAFNGVIYRFADASTGVRRGPPVSGTMGAARPNPFQSNATVGYSLATAGRAALEVFDVRGRRVATLVDGPVNAGDHAAVWDGHDGKGDAQPSGVYFCRLTVNGTPIAARRLVLIR